MRFRLYRGDDLPRVWAVSVGQPYGVAHLEVLPLRMDDVGVADVGSDGSLQQGVAVEARPILADLNQPRPDVVARSVDRHGAGRAPGAFLDEFVAGQRGADLVGSSTLGLNPGLHVGAVQRGDADGGHCVSQEFSLLTHALTLWIQGTVA